MRKEVYDTIIIGAGPAGLQAATFLGRANLKPLIIGKPRGSELWTAANAENIFALFPGRNGRQIMTAAIKQAKTFGARLLEDEVTHIWKAAKGKKGADFGVRTAKHKEYAAKTLIIASGKKYLTTGLEAEAKLKGNGVHYCVACDGWFYRKKKAVVIGNSNFAAEEALELLAYTKNVTILSNGMKFEFSPEYKRRLAKAQIKTINARVEDFLGKKRLEGLVLESGRKLDADGVFVALGTASALAFADKLGLEKEGDCLKCDRDGRTSEDGVYAAGGCTGGNLQVAKSVGEGCNAAISIIKKLKNLEMYADQT